MRRWRRRCGGCCSVSPEARSGPRPDSCWLHSASWAAPSRARWASHLVAGQGIADRQLLQRDHDQDELTGRWAALPVAHDPLLDAVELHGAHDLRHTYATWLEDAGIPARVIDELMGHQASSGGAHLGGSAIGAHYRHTTPEMAARVVEAIQQRLTVVLGVAELAVECHPNRSTLKLF